MELLIDGDVVAYKIASVCEEPVHWGNDFWTLHADAYEGKTQVDIWIKDVMSMLGASKVRVFLTGRSNFRAEFFEDYKANRKDTRKPMILNALKDHMKDEWDAELVEPLEADDLIGIAATEPEGGYDRIIVSVDKDFKSIPCKMYNPDKPEEGVITTSELAANRFHIFQTLVGDSSDNYKGCPSYGPVKAEKLMNGEDDISNLWVKVLTAFDKAGLSSKHALIQARVARILRHGDYDFETEKVKLWNP